MFEDHQYYNCKVMLDNGQEFRISANWMHNNNLDQWQGWACAAGSKPCAMLKTGPKLRLKLGLNEKDFGFSVNSNSAESIGSLNFLPSTSIVRTE